MAIGYNHHSTVALAFPDNPHRAWCSSCFSLLSGQQQSVARRLRPCHGHPIPEHSSRTRSEPWWTASVPDDFSFFQTAIATDVTFVWSVGGNMLPLGGERIARPNLKR